MKKGILFVCSLLLGGLNILPVFAQDTIEMMDPPALTDYVTDFSNVLDSDTLNALNSRAALYEQEHGPQIVTVLFPHRQGYDLFSIALNIFNSNGIGSAEKNDGLLLVIATEEKKIRIMVGYGLESQIPDLLASDIIEKDVRPLVNQGDFSGAVKAFYDRATTAIATNEGARFQERDRSISLSDTELLINIILAIIVFAIDAAYARKAKKLAKIRKENKEKNKDQKIKKLVPRPVILLFVFHTSVIFGFIMPIGGSYIGSYLFGPAAAAWIGIIVFARWIGVGGSRRGGSSSSSSGGRSSSSSSSSSSSFSGGGGSSGGGGAGD